MDKDALERRIRDLRGRLAFIDPSDPDWKWVCVLVREHLELLEEKKKKWT